VQNTAIVLGKGQADGIRALVGGGEQSPCLLSLVEKANEDKAIDLAAGRYSQHVFHQAACSFYWRRRRRCHSRPLLILGGAAARFIFKGLPPPDANCFHLHKPPTRRRRESARCPLDKLCHKESGSWLGVYCFTTAAPKAILRKAAAACTQRSGSLRRRFHHRARRFIIALQQPELPFSSQSCSLEQQLTASNYTFLRA
jgi:hypothetical protein